MTDCFSIPEIIHSVSGRKKAIAVARMIENHQIDIEEILPYLYSEDRMTCQRASWPLLILAEQNSPLLHPFIPSMLEALNSPVHDGIIRNIVRFWQFLEIPEDYEGEIFDKCFEFLEDPKIPAAIRIFSMSVCANIAEKHPELAEEVAAVISEHMDHGTAGFRSRGKKEIKRLTKSRRL